MTVKSSMESYAARLASFNATHPATKKRASDPKGKRTLKWPHKSPSPPQLARAGFFYRPSSSSPDNTTCYLCQSSLDGWEEEDDAVVEHLKHAPECGWAVTVAIEQDVENGSYSLENPMSERVLNARRMTFGTNWPHENKKGWVCKTKKMAEAGWHYCPTPESEDFVKCSYCQLSLDGWEPKDKPFDEHQRRSPDCSFFTLYASIEAKPGRAKKNRASKGSRMSTQSNFTAVSEGVSITETEANPDETMISTAESTKPTKSARGGKKASQARRPASKAKRKASRAKEEEPQVVSSFLEPEDDDFEVKVAPSPAATVSNNKRKSENISTTKASHGHLRTEENEVEAEQPSAKRRNTRARVSVAQAQETSINAPLGEDVLDTHMSDVEEMPPPSVPVSKKKGKGGRKRASSNTRKASNTSTASKASLRAAVPNDEEIEAALEADLDRPLTDDETGAEHAEIERPKGRRLTRTKPGSKKATASIAPTRRGTRASSVKVDEPPMTDIYPVIRAAAGEDSKAVLQKDSESLENYEIAKPSPEAKITKAKPSRKASAQQQSHDDCTKGNAETSDESVAVIHAIPPQLDAFVSKSQKPSTRRVSQQLPTRNTRASNVPDLRKFVDPVADVNNSMLATQTVHDDSGHETDAGGLKQSRTKRPNKKPSDAVKKSKRGKKAALASRNVEDVAHAPVNEIQPEETDEAPTVALDQTNIAEPVATESTLPEEVVVKVTKPTKPSKTKGKAAKAKAAAQKPPVPSSPEQSPTVIKIQDAPASPPPPPVHMTPPPALSPQSSDAENQPPSSRPSTLRPPLLMQSPSKSQMTGIPLAASTPISSPSKGNYSKLQSSLPWTAVDLGQLFNGSPNANKENDSFALGKATGSAQDELTSPEKKLTVEQWIQFNAQRGEESLRSECERLVGKFENEGVRALRTLEGIVCFN